LVDSYPSQWRDGETINIPEDPWKRIFKRPRIFSYPDCPNRRFCLNWQL